jgi:hypothetical protein
MESRMLRFFSFVAPMVFVIIFLMTAHVSMAAEYDIEIQYSYESNDQTQDAVAFKMYAEGTEVCTTTVVPEEDDLVACDASALRPGPYNWTMTAVFEDGNESPQSAPYAFTLPMPDPNEPNIILMRIRD